MGGRSEGIVSVLHATGSARNVSCFTQGMSTYVTGGTCNNLSYTIEVCGCDYIHMGGMTGAQVRVYVKSVQCVRDKCGCGIASNQTGASDDQLSNHHRRHVPPDLRIVAFST